MSKCSMQSEKGQFSARAALAAIGTKLRHLQLWRPIQERVQIPQKTVTYSPFEKLLDAFIAILAGAHGLVEINKRVRSDRALQAAFGRAGCAEQSVVQATLDAVTPENVEQMHAAMVEIFQTYAASLGHDYQRHYQLLDVDLTGLPCGPKAAFATKGYFAKQRDRRGRQLGRVLATYYHEIVVDRVYPGKQKLVQAFIPLLDIAEQVLGLDADQRARTILRVDRGGGSVADINWALARGYQYHGKDYSAQRVAALAATVTEWVRDPDNPEREVGWVTAPADLYVREVQRIAVRCRKKNGQWGYGVLISTLSDEEVVALAHRPCDEAQDRQAVMFAMVYFYDQRGGGVETSFKEDRQGLGINRRNKKRFEAQQLLTQLNVLAHNVIIWVRRWMAPHWSKLRKYGILRMVRDIFTTIGCLVFDDTGHLRHCALNPNDSLVRHLAPALAALLATEHVTVNSGET